MKQIQKYRTFDEVSDDAQYMFSSVEERPHPTLRDEDTHRPIMMKSHWHYFLVKQEEKQ